MRTLLLNRLTRMLLVQLTLALGFIGSASAVPAIQSLDVQPSPLRTGEAFSISVAATDVTQATATVDFRPWSATLLRVTLSLQGGLWRGNGSVPAQLQPLPGAQATVKVFAFNAARLRTERTVLVGVVAAPPPSSITAVFNAGTGVLTVTGDNNDNSLVVGRDAAGVLAVNNGAVPITGGIPTVATTTLVRILGLGGHDQISLDETNGAMPPGDLRGDAGNDTITGGSASDDLHGGPGLDTLTGKAGTDRHFGGDNDDTFIWNPGDGSDLIEGEGGTDTLVFNGSNASEEFDLSANGARLRFFRNVGNILMDVAGVEKVSLNALGGADNVALNDLSGTGVASVALDLANPSGSGTGDGQPDTVSVSGTQGADVITVAGASNGFVVGGLSATLNVAATEGALDQLTLNALGGEDVVDASALPAGRVSLTINGGLGDDVLMGSQGPDLMNGGDGDDLFLAGNGDDTMVWNPGDDNDVLEGQGGVDRMLFNGANVAENIDISANGGRIRFFRNIANVVMDANDVEVVEFNALGGADSITVNDLAGTDATDVRIDLANPRGSGTGDAQADGVTVHGTSGDDTIEVVQAAPAVVVTGAHATVTLTGAEGANDTLFIDGRGGNDTISASGLPSGLINLVMGGGPGDDTLTGSRGTDVLFGGDDDDTFIWNPGDGSDVIEGQGGSDVLVFNGSGAAEGIDISANGSRLRFFRDVGNIVMDVASVETIDFHALGGSDLIAVGDLSGTGVANVALDLALPAGTATGDGQSDSVFVNGTNGDDVIAIAPLGNGYRVSGLPAVVTVSTVEPLLDRLTVNALGGDDVVDASSLPGGVVALTINGGLGDDVLLGSDGPDLMNGGDGDDLFLAGDGDDTMVWNPGDDNDILEGQDGFDRMLFNGANVAENIDVSANGGRVIFFRNIANVVMDLNDVERVDFNALGGADVIVINDLSGTDVSAVRLDLGNPIGSGLGDGQPDRIIVNATNGDDVVLVTGSTGSGSVLGLAAQVDFVASEPANDRLVINLLAGDDVLEASGLEADVVALTGDGGADNDVLIGSDGPDTLLGGEGDDVLIGGPGLDILDGGPGDNIVIQ